MIKNYKFYLASILLWLIPFIGRLLMGEQDLSQMPEMPNVLMQSMNDAYIKNDSYTMFLIIAKNNLYGCATNILGGILLSIPTIANLVINGFASSDMFETIHSNGMSIHDILKMTLPHSIELIGFWMSGAIGFMISFRLLKMMKDQIDFNIKSFGKLLTMCSAVFVIIVVAAYIEAYVSMYIIK